MRYLGIDFGEKRIGLAIGDGASGIALPFKILLNDRYFFEELKKEITKEEIDAIVLGTPESLSGAGEMKQKILDFKKTLEDKINKSVYLEDEKFTSKIAEHLIGEYKKKDDAVEAAIILQIYLDKNTKG